MKFTLPAKYQLTVILILLAIFMGRCGNSGEINRGHSNLQAGMIIDSARHYIEIKQFDKANHLLLHVTPVEDSLPGVLPDTIFLINSLCGQVNLSVENYDRAFDFYSKALKIAEMPEYNPLLPEIYMHLAEYYTKISDSGMAYKYLDKAKQLLDPGAGNFSMLAALYLRYSSYSSDWAEKESNLEKALEFSEKSDDKYLIAEINNELGLLYRKTDTELSFGYFKRALNTWKEVKSDHNAMNTWLDIVEANVADDNFKIAMKQLDSFNILFMDTPPDYILTRYYNLSYQINYNEGRYDLAFNDLKTSRELEIIKMNGDKKAIINNLVITSSIRSENRRILEKQNEIARLRKLQVPLFLLFSLFALSAVSFFYYNRRIRKDNLKITQQHARISELYHSLEKQLSENNMMFKEMHHRVKNNLAMLTGIFHFQKNRIEDNEARQFLTDTNARIASIAMIHELVYAKNDTGRIPAGKYFEQLGMHIADLQDAPFKVDVKVICDKNIEAGQKLLYQLGIMINELMLNSVMNFRAETGTLNCTMSFEENETNYKFRYRDNRKNSDGGKILIDENTPGYHLVGTLTGRMGGRISTSSASEWGITITFPM